MAQATQLDATEQDTLVKQIGLALLRAAPRDWQRVTVEYRAVGRYHELSGEVTLSDGSVTEWVATHDIATLFGRLRAGMYREGRGTWFNARYQLDHPSSYNLEYDREEPDWDLMPPAQAYVDELHMFPRAEEDVPEWLMRRMSGLGPEGAEPRFRTARIFDGTDSTGWPVINREELEPEEQDRLLEYLDNAPVVVPSRGYDIDRLTGAHESRVPVAFHSDGTWIWPAAVNYYLREYGVSPETDLVEHVRANRFAVPDVADAQRQAAAAHINRATPAPQQASAAARRGPTQPREQPRPSEPATSFTPNPAADSGPMTMIAPPVGDEESAEHAQPGHVEPAATAAVPEHAEAVLDRLRVSLRDLRVDDTRYRIGEPAEHAWSLEETASGWRVGWYDEHLTNPAVFGDVADAAAFMLGKLLLAAGGPATTDAAGPETRVAEPAQGRHTNSHQATLPTELAAGAAASAATAPERPQAPAHTQARPEPDQQTQFQQSPMQQTQVQQAQPQQAQPQQAQPERAQPERAQQQSAGAPNQQWPIQPLAGEPPLTLFRGKELRELPAGSELDRFGGASGNLTYAAGTPFEERSLVPDWVNRPYHVYRVQRPLESLAGVAIPWFNQPGGGAAYLLPDSIEHHLAEGDLIELEAGDPPVE